MNTSKAAIAHTDRYTIVLQKHDLRALYSSEASSYQQDVLQGLGPLKHVFTLFLEHERQLAPLADNELTALFDSCSDATKSSDELLEVLYQLAPGNGKIGYQQVNFLTRHLRSRIETFLSQQGQPLSHQLHPHDHVFGSGGDFCKTIHASTAAAILASPFIKICKTGTTNVTSFHGSAQAMTEFGYETSTLSAAQINSELDQFGFAFLPLSALGFPYSPALKEARGRLWYEANDRLTERWESGLLSRQAVIRETPIPMDIFKIVSPNAQVLNPRHHTTGVCHSHMIPYVLSLFLELNTQGMIVYSYDGIDEFATASSDLDKNNRNNLLIWVRANDIVITECSPEDLGFARAPLEEIAEEENLSATNNDLWRVIAGQERGPKRDFLVANAALLLVAGEHKDVSQGDLIDRLQIAVKQVETGIDSGKTGENFGRLLAMHNRK